MADIKTHLRELIVTATIGLLNSGIEFQQSDLYDSQRFLSYAQRVVSNDISSARNLSDYAVFSGDLRIIVDNGYKLGKKIYMSPPSAFPTAIKTLFCPITTRFQRFL